ncbi:OmpA family protein, partial [Leptospira interrogans]|nr:OmpA family protein [Leptospira interrogans]
IQEHEPLTPRLSSRLKNIKEALNSGWQVRIITDGKGSSEPIVPMKNPETDYKNRRTEFQIISR